MEHEGLKNIFEKVVISFSMKFRQGGAGIYKRCFRSIGPFLTEEE